MIVWEDGADRAPRRTGPWTLDARRREARSASTFVRQWRQDRRALWGVAVLAAASLLGRATPGAWPAQALAIGIGLLGLLVAVWPDRSPT